MLMLYLDKQNTNKNQMKLEYLTLPTQESAFTSEFPLRGDSWITFVKTGFMCCEFFQVLGSYT